MGLRIGAPRARSPPRPSLKERLDIVCFNHSCGQNVSFPGSNHVVVVEGERRDCGGGDGCCAGKLMAEDDFLVVSIWALRSGISQMDEETAASQTHLGRE
jgi:hypothetical protein